MHAPSLWPCFKLLYQGNCWKRNCLNRPELLTIWLLSLVHPCIVIQPLYLIQCGSSEEEEKLLRYRESTTTIHSRMLTLQICISLRWVSALILKYEHYYCFQRTCEAVFKKKETNPPSKKKIKIGKKWFANSTRTEIWHKHTVSSTESAQTCSACSARTVGRLKRKIIVINKAEISPEPKIWPKSKS